MAVLVLARFGRSCGIFFASHSSLSPPESFVVRRWRASRFGRGGWFWPNGEVGVETSLAAASSRDRGAQRWGPKSSPRGEEGCSLAGDSFLCVSLPYDVLRRLLRSNLRYTATASSSTDSFCARARRGHEPSAGSGGIPSVHGEKPGAAFLLHVWQVSLRSHPSRVQGVRQNWRKASSGAPVAKR